MKLTRVVVARPGGNDTALVFDDVHADSYRDINAYIQKKNPDIEQVMFVKNDQAMPMGIMAGGEFCGNATRSLGYYLLKGNDGAITLSISGAKTPLTVKVQDKNATTKMPIISNPTSVKFLDDTSSLVKLEGITHLVLEPLSELAQQMKRLKSMDDKKAFARELLIKHDLQHEAAGGIMALDKDDDKLMLAPFVYVKSIDTFYAETACGSGSVAVGLALAKRRTKSVTHLEVRQPSGHSIFVDVNFAGGFFEEATIKGKVEILYEGEF